jgi:hypothetical protein
MNPSITALAKCRQICREGRDLNSGRLLSRHAKGKQMSKQKLSGRSNRLMATIQVNASGKHVVKRTIERQLWHRPCGVAAIGLAFPGLWSTGAH